VERLIRVLEKPYSRTELSVDPAVQLRLTELCGRKLVGLRSVRGIFYQKFDVGAAVAARTYEACDGRLGRGS